MNARKANKGTKAKIVPIRSSAKCSWCNQALEFPPRFNALIYCPNKNVRAQDVPENLTRCTLPNRHVLVEGAELQRRAPGRGLLARVGAAIASAAHIFKASGRD